jgi:hypothetical protein
VYEIIRHISTLDGVIKEASLTERESMLGGSGTRHFKLSLNSRLGTFRFGFSDHRHGLSYTSFEYSSITLDKKRISKDEKLTATVKVKNIGSFAGAEAVQFYVADTQSYLKRPVKELKGFKKVHLKPGETKVVSFVVDKYAISYFDEDRSSWLAEKGTFTVLVGASSADIKATADFQLSTTYWWTGL